MKNLIIILAISVYVFLSYSCEKKLITPGISVPAVFTSVTGFSQTTASFEGKVMSDGGDLVFSYGFCWSLSPEPNIEKSNSMEIYPSGLFESTISNLTPNTEYYFRTYATNSAGTGYGNTIMITTLISSINFNPNMEYGLVTDIENNVYKTINIGTQTWMAENLRTTKYRNGDLIVTTDYPLLDISNENAPKYQWSYNGNENISNVYGRLYTWYAINDSRNICPTGWHVPINAEWITLTDYLSNNGYNYGDDGSKIAKSMATTSGWITDGTAGNIGNDQPSNNSSGFSTLPSGSRVGTSFSYISYCGYWWSATEKDSTYAWRGCYMTSFSGKVYNDYINKQDGFSVRCIKDN